MATGSSSAASAARRRAATPTAPAASVFVSTDSTRVVLVNEEEERQIRAAWRDVNATPWNDLLVIRLLLPEAGELIVPTHDLASGYIRSIRDAAVRRFLLEQQMRLARGGE